jgi:hypothetical protein
LQEQRQESNHMHQQNQADATLDPAEDWCKLVASTLIRDGMTLFVEPANIELMVAHAQDHHCKSMKISMLNHE